ncbi:hypothetical protein BGZ74_009390 [Mortierella antarctica]|nr:hypothetical protein BGZ74_009390 [Mortierella antarctica]
MNFWKGCHGVRSVVATGLQLDCSQSHPFFGSELGIFPNLEYIRVTLEDKSRLVDQRLVMERCPKLTGCFLNAGYRGNRSSSRGSSRSSSCDSNATMETTESKESTVPTLDQVFQEQQLSDLDSICVGSEIDFEDADLSSCLEAMDRVRRLTVDQGDFGRKSFYSLVPHFNVLQCLVLERCYGVTGSMVQRILESCPMLINIVAPRIEATQIISRKRWLCLGLKTFKACIVLDSKGYSIGVQSRMVYVQLARLTQLEHVDIAADRGKGIQSLDLRLASGLYQLSTLSKLRGLRYAGTIQHISIDDVQWMRGHWRLKTYPVVHAKKGE